MLQAPSTKPQAKHSTLLPPFRAIPSLVPLYLFKYSYPILHLRHSFLSQYSFFS